MRLELDVSTENEGVGAPWWIIIDPFVKNIETAEQVSGMITGPFFSKEAAENYLFSKRYHFSNKARVLCKSGSPSAQYSYAYHVAKSYLINNWTER
jgi:hypothetical protein